MLAWNKGQPDDTKVMQTVIRDYLKPELLQECYKARDAIALAVKKDAIIGRSPQAIPDITQDSDATETDIDEDTLYADAMSISSEEPITTPNKSADRPPPVIAVTSPLKRQRISATKASTSHTPITPPSTMKQTQIPNNIDKPITLTSKTTDNEISSMSKSTLAHIAEQAATNEGNITKATNFVNFNIPRL